MSGPLSDPTACRHSRRWRFLHPPTFVLAPLALARQACTSWFTSLRKPKGCIQPDFRKGQWQSYLSERSVAPTYRLHVIKTLQFIDLIFLCQCKKWRSSLFLLDNRKWRTFHLKDNNGKLWINGSLLRFWMQYPGSSDRRCPHSKQ